MKQIWIIAPGEGAKYMDKCIENSMIILGWDCVGDIKQYKDKEALKEALKQKCEEYKDKNPAQAANMLWSFANEIKVGDIILARNGLTKIVGVGTVTQEYIAPDNTNNPSDIDEYHQAIKVQWNNTEVQEVPHQMSRNSIVKVDHNDEDKFKDILNISSTNDDFEINNISDLEEYYTTLCEKETGDDTLQTQWVYNQLKKDKDNDTYPEEVKEYIELMYEVYGYHLIAYEAAQDEYAFLYDAINLTIEYRQECYSVGAMLEDYLIETEDFEGALEDAEQIEELDMNLFEAIFGIFKVQDEWIDTAEHQLCILSKVFNEN